MPKTWTADEIHQLTRGFQPACVLIAAADLDLFAVLADAPLAADEIARRLSTDLRATTILLDALTALELLTKHDGRYALAAGVADALTQRGAHSMLAMVRHMGVCMRRWAQLARVTQTGRPAVCAASIRGETGDQESFIEAMDNICAPIAAQIVADLRGPNFQHLLDIGGGSGTWTIAFLRANPAATATLFDLPQVLPMAKRRLSQAGLRERVALVAGDFYTDALPQGADLAWISAISHQNSRAQNRQLFAKVADALRPGGRILIRDFVMDDSHTAPAAGALFAVNMLSATEGGRTFSFAESREDLEQSGFVEVTLLRDDGTMHSVVAARTPA
ncbi:MAG: methyltransferase domain-containing protein [Verrucomicrobia bacterium]|nr:methyltransferase domain-containing protein [Verrucomicrobiota bacterium]